jgi:uncharacterized protein YndB with AHSA1/START domain
MATPEWSRFVVRIDVKAGIPLLYRLWTTQAGLESWFLRSSLFTNDQGQLCHPEESVQPGYAYTWHWHGYPDTVLEQGQILEVNGSDRLCFSFGKAGNCLVTLEAWKERSIVTIEQYDIPTDEASKFQFHIGCQQGWTFYLANLKSIAEGGIDLRNRDESLQQVINS